MDMPQTIPLDIPLNIPPNIPTSILAVAACHSIPTNISLAIQMNILLDVCSVLQQARSKRTKWLTNPPQSD